MISTRTCALMFSLLLAPISGWAATPSPSTTTLLLSSSSVSNNTAVILVAEVSSGGKAVTTGQVLFCDAAATYCEDSAILRTAQLTSAGTAAVKLTPGIGTHSIKAVFVGTNTIAGSSSNAEPLSVTGQYPTTTTVAVSGSSGSYTLSATVAGIGSLTAGPTEQVSFLSVPNGTEIGAATLGASTPELNFSPGTGYALSGLPNCVAVGDFNRDGWLDIAVATGSAISVLLGKGDGTFLNQVTYGTGSNSVAVGDFNGDGIPDLVATNYGSNTVSVFLGSGHGLFQSPVTYATGSGPAQVVVGDFNGDGKQDLATVEENLSGTSVTSSLLSILLGNGDGTFQSQLQSDIPSIAVSLAAGDFNGDGKLDLAIVGSASTTADGSASVLLGNGDGTFQTGVNYATGVEPQSVVTGDFNGDGKPDLAVWNFSGSSTSVLLNNGDGTFQSQKTYGLGSSSSYIAVGDFNRDGKLDLASLNLIGNPSRGATNNTVGILQGNGDGTFQNEVTYGTLLKSPVAFAVGDFNDDGNPDLAVTDNWNANTVYAELNQFAQTATATTTNVQPGFNQYFDAVYSGDSNYIGSYSCQIGLNTNRTPSAPVISGVTVSNITSTSATISWTSNFATYGGVNYGLTTAFGSKTPWPLGGISTAQSFTLTGLTPGSTYDYQAWSVAYFSGCTHWTTFAPTATFTTANQ